MLEEKEFEDNCEDEAEEINERGVADAVEHDVKGHADADDDFVKQVIIGCGVLVIIVILLYLVLRYYGVFK